MKHCNRMPYGIVVLSFLLILAMAVCGQAESFWPMFQRDPEHTGLAPVSTPEWPQLLWETDVTEIFPGADSHLVLGVDGCLWAVGVTIIRISASGEILSRFGAGEGLIGGFKKGSAPVVLIDGCIAAVAGLRNEEHVFVPTLYVIEPTGDVRWTLPLEGQAGQSLLTLGHSETIYCVCDQHVYAISVEGEVHWSYTCEVQATTFPAVAEDGTVYFGAKNGCLYSLSSEGSLNWTFATDSPPPISSAPAIDESGNVYFVASMKGFYCLGSDGEVLFSYPSARFCYTSPVLLSDGSVVFLGGEREGSCELICLGPLGEERYTTALVGDQDPLTGPVADQDGNVYVAYMSYEQGPPPFFRHHFAKVDREGNYRELLSLTSLVFSNAGGLCIGADGTVYGYLGNAVGALGSPPQSLSIGVSSGLVASMDPQLGWIRATSIWTSNPLGPIDADCYIAYRRHGSDQLFFYPFWSNEPIGCALEFRPLPAGAQFPKIELIHLQERGFEPGQYEWLAGLFEPGTFNPACEIASCEFTVYAQHAGGSDFGCTKRDETANGSAVQETPPAISLWTDKASYSAGEVLNLSLGLENQGLGMPFDLYIAATLDADPSGTLFFFPTWATNPAFTNIGFLPLPQGASLPALTIMHLALPDALPRGGYKFLAAFFHVGTFELASDIAEARWTLM